jgi:hypothetical protein
MRFAGILDLTREAHKDLSWLRCTPLPTVLGVPALSDGGHVMPVSKRCNYCNDPIMYLPRQSIAQGYWFLRKPKEEDREH